MTGPKIITLLTDFGESEYVGAMKGVILKISPRTQIVDLTHQISPQNIVQAAYILQSSYSFFPAETIHLVVVDPGVGTARKIILLKTQKYYFLGPDNGVFSLLSEKVKKIIWVRNKKYFAQNISSTFHGRDIFAPVAAHLSAGEPVEKFGPELQKYQKLPLLPPPGKKQIKVSILHFDRFGNVSLNIPHSFYQKYLQGKKFKLQIGPWEFDKVYQTYSQVEKGTPLLLFGSSNFLEIAVREGNAQKFFNLSFQHTFPLKIEN